MFDVSTRLFIKDKLDFGNTDFFSLEDSSTASESGDDEWSVSGSFDISDFSNGFFLTIKNTLTVKSKKRSPVSVEDSEWLSQCGEKPGSIAKLLADGHDYNKLKQFKKRWWHGNRNGRGYHDSDRLFMQKEIIGIGLGGSSEVPVPAAAWLFGSALCLVSAIKRKKS